MAHFAPSRVHELYGALLNAGLLGPSTLRALCAGINGSFLAMAPSGDTAATGALLLLDHLNRTARLRDGSVPMEIFLANAVGLAGYAPEADVLQAALDEVRRGATVARAVPPPEAAARARAWADAGGVRVKERIIGRDETLSFGFLAAGHAAGQAVAKLEVRRYEGGAPASLPGGDPVVYSGTGWLVAESLLVTNHHVINARGDVEPDASLDDLRRQAEGTAAVFDFDAEGAAGSRVEIARLEAFSAPLDYAVVRLAGAPGRRPMRIADRALDPAASGRAAMNIIQHPDGRAKRVALRSNLLVSVAAQEVQYLTDTERGSSGSPVCDDRWQVVAIHRASTRVSGGLPEGITSVYVNTGVPITAVVGDLRERYPELAAEILPA